MAMNKREQKALADAQNELAYARALRWSTEAAGPDLEPPLKSGEYTSGWLVIGGGEHARIVPAWSQINTHGWGDDRPREGRSGSQGSRQLFSTRQRALAVLRNQLEDQYARKLAAIDAELV